jgi:hypothetical protein
MLGSGRKEGGFTGFEQGNLTSAKCRGSHYLVCSRPSPSVCCWRVCPRIATELAQETRKAGLTDRVATTVSWLSEAERGGSNPRW